MRLSWLATSVRARGPRDCQFAACRFYSTPDAQQFFAGSTARLVVSDSLILEESRGGAHDS